MRKTSLKNLIALKYRVPGLRGLYGKSRIMSVISDIDCGYDLKEG